MPENTVLSKISQQATLAAIWAYFLVPYFPANTPQFFGKSISVPQVVLLFAFICAGFSFLYGVIRRREQISRPILELGGVLGALLFVLALSTFVAHGASQESVLLVTSLAGIVMTVFTALRLSRASIDIFFVSIAWVTIVACILGLAQFYFFGDAASPAAYLGQEGHVFNATGFANYSSLFGASLALFMPLFLLLGHLRYSGKRVLWTVAFLMSISALLLTFSRSSLLSACIGCALVYAWSFSKKYDRKYTAAILLLSILVGIWTLTYVPPKNYASEIFTYHTSAGEVLSGRFSALIPKAWGVRGINNTTTKSAPSIEWSAYNRYVFYRVAKDMLSYSVPSFVFGYGLQGFNKQWEYFRGDFGTPTGLDPHSTYIEVAVAGGVCGLLALALFLGLLYKYGWSIRIREPAVIGLLGGLTAMLVDGLFHTYFYTKYFWIVVGVTVALIWSAGRQSLDDTLQS